MKRWFEPQVGYAASKHRHVLNLGPHVLLRKGGVPETYESPRGTGLPCPRCDQQWFENWGRV